MAGAQFLSHLSHRKQNKKEGGEEGSKHKLLRTTLCLHPDGAHSMSAVGPPTENDAGAVRRSPFAPVIGVITTLVFIAMLLETERLGGPATRPESVRVSVAMAGNGGLGERLNASLGGASFELSDVATKPSSRNSKGDVIVSSSSSSSSRSQSSSSSSSSRSRSDNIAVVLKDHGSDATTHTALLLRAHLLTGVQMQRLAAYARWCSEARPSIELWVSFDTTTVVGERKRVEKVLAEEHGLPAVAVNFHEYNTKEMVAKYPGLDDVHTRVFKSWRGKSLALGFHNEAIDLWWTDPRVVAKQLRWIWVMELDVGFSGPITRLLYNYTDTDADYIMHQTGCHTVDNRWLHRFACSKAYKEFVSKDKRMYSFEFTQRYSRAFLAELSRRIGAGAHAWSEEVGCSTHLSSNLTAITLRSHHQGSPFTFKHGRAINNKTFFAKWNSPNLANRLYHPVKGL